MSAYDNHPTVAERIAMKLALLRKWTAEGGVPEGFSCPSSLAKARTWNDPENGVFSIGSKREWNTKNSPHRSSIVAIARLIGSLSAQTSRSVSNRRSKDVRIDELQDLLKATDAAREDATTQWQELSQKLMSRELELKAAAAERAFLKSQLEEARSEMRDLRRRAFNIREV
ncbi:hypothetical protein [Rhizobium ruizarguesonis]|uniref:hypothetical protein n=1 Tax=Rhizobium ruizarguesonis TaxID=2081791 RepID=UPI00103247F4|nr:hypothetical protein [Rhizobium ruizarguesonis]TBF31482.1 hypothetical protein ELG93_14605 [Rhizobium ruizarguesonis]